MVRLRVGSLSSVDDATVDLADRGVSGYVVSPSQGSMNRQEICRSKSCILVDRAIQVDRRDEIGGRSSLLVLRTAEIKPSIDLKSVDFGRVDARKRYLVPFSRSRGGSGVARARQRGDHCDV